METANVYASAAALWWLAFWAALGLAIGSFLNVVIFRLPRNRSLRAPLWSACPHCRTRIRWYDNIPIVSFALLRGRCRECAVPIASRYVVVEALMAIVVLMLFDAFFVSQVRTGLDVKAFGLADRLAADWPIFLAHIILFASLLAMSAIDLEHYWVDIRFTNLVIICGFVLHTFWTPFSSANWTRPWPETATVCVMAMFGLAVTWLALLCQPHADPEDFGEPAEEEQTPSREAEAKASSLPPSLQAPTRVGGIVAVLIFLALAFLVFVDAAGWANLRHTGRTIVPLVFIFALIVAESTVPRESDDEIAEAIDEERSTARQVALTEFALLVPAVLLGLLGWWLVSRNAGFETRAASALSTEFRPGILRCIHPWQPLMGFATAATGFMIAGALGWAVRIFFTLVFGREAFGTGDIHMMAAAGCVAGWPVVVLGFFLTCILALAGWTATLPFKKTRALPLGPWLTLSFLIVVVFYDPLIEWPVVDRAVTVITGFMENSQPRLLGVPR